MLFPANAENISFKISMDVYCDVTSLCIFGALKSYLFLVLSRVPLMSSKRIEFSEEKQYKSGSYITHNVIFILQCLGLLYNDVAQKLL